MPGRDIGAVNAGNTPPGIQVPVATGAPPDGYHPHRPPSPHDGSRPVCQHQLSPNPWTLTMTGWNGQPMVCLLCGQGFTLLKASLTGFENAI